MWEEGKKKQQVGLTWIIFRDVFSLKWRKTDLFFLCQIQCFWYVRIVYFNTSEADCVGICKMCWFPLKRKSQVLKTGLGATFPFAQGLDWLAYKGTMQGFCSRWRGCKPALRAQTTCLPAGTVELDVGLADRFWHSASHMLVWLTLLLVAPKNSSCQYIAGGGHVPVLAHGNWWL